MSRVVTQADVGAIAAGGILAVDDDATITPLAAELAVARNITISRGGDGSGSDAAAERELVRAVTRSVVERLGNAGPQVVEAVVTEVLGAVAGSLGSGGGPLPITTARGATLLPSAGGQASLEMCRSCIEQEKARRRSRAILTTTGRNTRGIVARVTSRIAELGGDILDISQTLVSDYFTMIIVVDVSDISVSFEGFRDEVDVAVRQTGCEMMMMHEDVLTSLHRV